MRKIIFAVGTLVLLTIGCRPETGPAVVPALEHLSIALTDENFADEVLNSEQPVLVDFYATWCGPCERMAPIVEQIAAEYEGRAVIGKVDVDLSEIDATYEVANVPTFIVFKDGKPVGKIEGALPRHELAAMIDAVL